MSRPSVERQIFVTCRRRKLVMPIAKLASHQRASSPREFIAHRLANRRHMFVSDVCARLLCHCPLRRSLIEHEEGIDVERRGLSTLLVVGKDSSPSVELERLWYEERS